MSGRKRKKAPGAQITRRRFIPEDEDEEEVTGRRTLRVSDFHICRRLL